jgi:hypothetical protein
MEFRLPFNSAKPPFYVSLTPAFLSRQINTWEGPTGSHDADPNWNSNWGDVEFTPADNKDANNAVEVLYLKDIPKRGYDADPSDTMWLTNSRVQIQDSATDAPTLSNQIELGIRDCDTKHRPWDGLTIEVTGYMEYTPNTPPYLPLTIYDVVFEFTLAKEDFQTTPLTPDENNEGLGYSPILRIFWFLIDGPEVPSGATYSTYTIQEIVSVTPTSPFEPPTPA